MIADDRTCLLRLYAPLPPSKRLLIESLQGQAEIGAGAAGGAPALKTAPVKGKAPVETGLGKDVDNLAAKSPSLQQDIQKLKADGWKIKYGAPGGGSYADRNAVPPKITIDSKGKTEPRLTTQTLAHEVGHALYPYKADLSSKAAYVNDALADEGAATLNDIKVQREINANGGPDIKIAGQETNHSTYNKAYDQSLKDGNAASARKTIGTQFGKGETTSTTKEPYADYYGGWYDKNHPAKK